MTWKPDRTGSVRMRAGQAWSGEVPWPVLSESPTTTTRTAGAAVTAGCEELASATEALMQRLAQGPTQAYGHLKRLLRSSLQSNLSPSLIRYGTVMSTCMWLKRHFSTVQSIHILKTAHN